MPLFAGCTGVLSLVLGLGLGTAAWAGQPKLALFGFFPGQRSLEVEAAQEAVDDSNALRQGPRLKLEIFNTGPVSDAAAALAAAERVADDPDVLAVVVHGEEGVAPGPLGVFKRAHLAVVAASSWAQPREAGSGVTWLCPDLNSLAGTAALYARREARMIQIAVVDDGSATSTAAARIFAARYRAAGGKIPYVGTWDGGAASLSATVKSMAPYWPQMVFYTGGGRDAGRLLLAMKTEKALRNADLFGLPPLFDPAFFDTTRVKGMRTRAIFPSPDYEGMNALVRDLGFAFPRTSPQYRAYIHVDFRHPGYWTAMLYDGAGLAARAAREAALSAVQPQAAASASPLSLSPSAKLSSTNIPGVTATATAFAASPSPTPATDLSALPAPGRDAVRLALLGIPGYKGIRGEVKFGADREPSTPKAMVYFALNRVNSKEMVWKQRAYGPPF